MEPTMKRRTGFLRVRMSIMLNPPERDEMEMSVASSQYPRLFHPATDSRYENITLSHKTTYTQIRTLVKAELNRCIEHRDEFFRMSKRKNVCANVICLHLCCACFRFFTSKRLHVLWLVALGREVPAHPDPEANKYGDASVSRDNQEAHRQDKPGAL